MEKTESDEGSKRYEELAKQRIKIASVQVRILNAYDPKNEELRFEALHTAARKAMIHEQSEVNLYEIDEIIHSFSKEIKKYREEKPELESQNPELRKKISVMETLLSSD